MSQITLMSTYAYFCDDNGLKRIDASEEEHRRNWRQLLQAIQLELDEPLQAMMYDISTDERRPVTQKDVDEMLDFIHKAIQVKSALEELSVESTEPWKFQLAVFPNPHRLGEAFIAEAKSIEPYAGLQYKGETYFPPVPRTEWTTRASLPVGFASEIVRRWNRVPGQY